MCLALTHSLALPSCVANSCNDDLSGESGIMCPSVPAEKVECLQGMAIWILSMLEKMRDLKYNSTIPGADSKRS